MVSKLLKKRNDAVHVRKRKKTRTDNQPNATMEESGKDERKRRPMRSKKATFAI
jgi:hypothetical protein